MLFWIWLAEIAAVRIMRSNAFGGFLRGLVLAKLKSIGDRKEYEKLGQLIAAVIFSTVVLFGSQDSAANLKGVVQDATGTTLEGALVILRADHSGQEIARCRTDGSGVYSFTAVRPGVYRIEVTAAGFNTVEVRDVHVEPGEQKSVSAVTLHVGNACGVPAPQHLRMFRNSIGAIGRLSGTVVDGQGRPIRAAKVLLIGRDNRPVATVSTDAAGRYTFPALEARDYSMRIQREGYFDGEQGPYTVQVGFDVTYWPIVLERCRPGNCQPWLKRKKVASCE